MSSLNLPPPDLAEYLDRLYALHELFPGETGAQQQWLGRLSAYGYLKHGVVKQAIHVRIDYASIGRLGVMPHRYKATGLCEYLAVRRLEAYLDRERSPGAGVNFGVNFSHFFLLIFSPIAPGRSRAFNAI